MGHRTKGGPPLLEGKVPPPQDEPPMLDVGPPTDLSKMSTQLPSHAHDSGLTALSLGQMDEIGGNGHGGAGSASASMECGHNTLRAPVSPSRRKPSKDRTCGGNTTSESIHDFARLREELKCGRPIELNSCRTFRYKKKPEWTWTGGPLHLACIQPPSEDSSKVAQTLLDMKAQVNEYSKCEDSTVSMLLPLHVAAGSNNAAAVRLLVEAGASVDKKSKQRKENGEKIPEMVDHFTALHEAVHFGNLASTQALLEARADPNAKNMNKQTPLNVVLRAWSEQ
eukprot:936683-Amphidinium_carterae.1